MKTYGGVGVKIHILLNTALAAGVFTASRPPPPRFTSRERTPGTNLRGGLVGPRVNLEDVELTRRWEIQCTYKGLAFVNLPKQKEWGSVLRKVPAPLKYIDLIIRDLYGLRLCTASLNKLQIKEWRCMGAWENNPYIPNLGSRWRWMVKYTLGTT
jgi:hypothetical protein